MAHTHQTVNGVRVSLTADEITACKDRDTEWSNGQLNRDLDSLRNKRNKLLEETDYLALSDLTLTSEMQTYRQKLRDLPTGLDTVEKVAAKAFPTKP
jgi:hypothetical protein